MLKAEPMTKTSNAQRFRGDLSPDEARDALHLASEDRTLDSSWRSAAAAALHELRSGRTVRTTMAGFRRQCGLDQLQSGIKRPVAPYRS